MNAVNLVQECNALHDYWKSAEIGRLNDSHVYVCKMKGEWNWHHHEEADEMFLVVKGRLLIRLRDREIRLSEGECCVIPKGIEHQTIAEEEAHVMLLE